MPQRTRLLVLQPTSLCNLDCSYCYVPDRRSGTIMSRETLEATLRLFLTSALVGNALTILWHAGEPLAAGLGFYREAARLIRACNTRAIGVIQSIQTNATLLNQEWGSFFRDEGFDVGVSVDGPAHVHDFHRRRLDGNRMRM